MTQTNAVLPALDAQQQAVLERTSGETLLLAVPGSGKTTVLLARIAHLVQDCNVTPESILALSYSRSAAEEMATRYETTYGGTGDSAPAFSTIHAFCLSVLRYAAAKAQTRLPVLEPDTGSLIRQTLRQVDNTIWPPERLVRDLEGKLTQVKNRLSSREDLESIVLKDLERYPSLTFTSFVEQYDQYKRRRNLMDFDDQLLLAYTILLQQPAPFVLYSVTWLLTQTSWTLKRKQSDKGRTKAKPIGYNPVNSEPAHLPKPQGAAAESSIIIENLLVYFSLKPAIIINERGC